MAATIAERPVMERVSGTVLHSLHRETRADILHRRHVDQPFIESIELGHVGDRDVQQVIDIPRHPVQRR